MRALAIVLVLGCNAKPPPPPPPPTVDVATLQTTNVVEATEYLARLRSRTAATLQPQVDGRITKILVKPGDTVTAGQTLLEIDPGRQPAAVAAARDARTARQAALDLAERNLSRTEKLVASGALPRQELDNAQTAAMSARADVAALGAELHSSRVALRYYTVTAPGPGVIGDIPVRVGDMVTPQTQLTTVTDSGVLEANVAVPVERSHAISSTTTIEIVDDANQTIGTGTVSFVSPQVAADTQTVLVKADIDNAKGTLRADQVVRARVVWATRPGLAVPALAVTRTGGQAFVFVAESENQRVVARQRPVQLGDLIDNRYVVTSGLKPGERLITSNIQKVRNGAPVQIKG